jgi:hypothetical protein
MTVLRTFDESRSHEWPKWRPAAAALSCKRSAVHPKRPQYKDSGSYYKLQKIDGASEKKLHEGFRKEAEDA